MSVAVYGTKVGMTRVFDGDEVTPVTVVQVLPNEVVRSRPGESSEYSASAVKVACGPQA